MKSGKVDQAKPPRFFYGWVVVATAFCVALVAYGIQYSFGVFLKPLSADFGSRTLVSGVASLFMFSRGTLAILTGWVTDRYGPRIIVAIGGFFLGLGLILTSQSSAAWQLYLFYGLMGGFGLSVAFAPLVATASRWFVSKRGLAIGIVTAGIGVGLAVMPRLATDLIATYDNWSQPYIILGILALIIIIPGAFLLRRSPEEKGLLPLGKAEAIAGDEENLNTAKKENSLTSESAGFSLKDAARTRAFWLLLAMIIFWATCIQMAMMHIPSHATKGLGIPGVVAANFLAVIGISSIIGRLVMGAVSDRLGGKRTLVICLALQALAMFWLLRATDIWMLYLFAAVFGFAYGGCVPLLPVIAGEIFELKSIGAIVGVHMLGVAIGGAIGPLLAGYVFDVTQSYYFAFMVSGMCTILALILLAFIRAPRKVRY